MTPLTADQRRARASIAARTRHNPSDPALTEARRDLCAERLVEHARTVVAATGPLTSDQRERVAAALCGPELCTERLVEHAQKVIAATGPLTTEQRERVTAALRGSPDRGGVPAA